MPGYNLTPSFARQFLFRFLFIFFFLFIIVENNGTNPFIGMINYHVNSFWELFASWTASHVFHLSYPISTKSNGSGDTTYHYLLLFIFLIMAMAGAILWQTFDRRRSDFSNLDYWLTTVLRYYLGLMLINYGIVKLFDMQFGRLTLGRLSETYGASSPMGLAWTFLSFSHGYNIFMGVAELLGFLLLFRRTTTLGAFIALMTTLNVMMINYCFDVPVKIVSTSLVIMASFILLKSAGPLFKFFFTGQAVALPVMPAPEIKSKWLRRGKIALKVFFLLYPLLVLMMMFNHIGTALWEGPKPKLYGLYEVESATLNRSSVNEKNAEALMWKQLIISNINPSTGMCYSTVRHSNDSTFIFTMNIDSLQRKMKLLSLKDSTYICNFNYLLPDSNHLLLNGFIDKDSVTMLFKKQASDVMNFRLMKRGFHWINEQPYNM